jgi:hypothetical protein
MTGNRFSGLRRQSGESWRSRAQFNYTDVEDDGGRRFVELPGPTYLLVEPAMADLAINKFERKHPACSSSTPQTGTREA